MNKETEQIISLWKKELSDRVNKNRNFDGTRQFQQIAKFFSPGNSYYYIINFFNLQFEFVSDEVEKVTGFPTETVTMNDLLSIVQDLKDIQQKEKVVLDFAINHTTGNELLNYKFLYTFRIKDRYGKQRTMLLQNMALSMSEDGGPRHVLGVHTDVTHLKMAPSNTISIINLSDGPSYYNLRTDKGYFDAANIQTSNQTIYSLSRREIEIVDLLAKGLSSVQIADELSISDHTVRTHRSNILKKLDCHNTTDLVLKCLAAGLIKLT